MWVFIRSTQIGVCSDLFAVMKTICILVVLVVSALAAPQGVGQYKYTNHRLLQIEVTTRSQAHFVHNLEAIVGVGLDFWQEPGIFKYAQVRVPPGLYSAVVQQLEEQNIPFTVLSSDVQSLLENVPVKDIQFSLPKNFNPNIDHSKYYNLAGVVSNLNALAAAYPTLARVVNLNKKTYENRDIKLLELSTNGWSSKPVIFLECGLHAREWISPAVCQYLADRLLATYQAGDADARFALDTFDWSIVVVANPDGYQYSHSTTRLWRKNRAVNSGGCIGTDLNRNFAAAWNTTGVSQNPCADTYPGRSVFSENEAQAIRDKVYEYQGQNQRLVAFVPIHSYSQYILIPSGYRYGCKPSNYNEILSSANTANAALRAVNNKIFVVGNTAEILYASSGGSDDWAGIAKVRYTATYELRPDANDFRVGFQLPANEILPSGEEFWAAWIAHARTFATTHLPSKTEICS